MVLLYHKGNHVFFPFDPDLAAILVGPVEDDWVDEENVVWCFRLFNIIG